MGFDVVTWCRLRHGVRVRVGVGVGVRVRVVVHAWCWLWHVTRLLAVLRLHLVKGQRVRVKG